MPRYPAKGTKIYFGSANPPTTEVLNLGDIEFDPGERLEALPTHDHNNTSGVLTKMDSGWKQAASLSFAIDYDPADTVHEDMRAVHATYAARNVKLVLPDAGNATIVGPVRVKSFPTALPVSGKVTNQVVLEFLDAFTFTA